MANSKPGLQIALPIIACLVIVAAIVLFTRDWSLEESHSLIGQLAPEIEFDMPDGNGTKLSEKRGTTILLNFWATWCEPCMSEMPGLKALEKHFRNKGFLLLALNIEDIESDNLKGKISGEKMPENLIFHVNKAHMANYGLQGIPVSILIDKHGTIQKIYEGPQDWVTPAMVSEIERIINN